MGGGGAGNGGVGAACGTARPGCDFCACGRRWAAGRNSIGRARRTIRASACSAWNRSSPSDWYQSLEAGKRIAIPPPNTIADGLRTPIPGEVTFPIVSKLAAGVLLVSEDEIKAAVRFLLTRLKILAEPSGAVPAAALLRHKVPIGIAKAGIILSGGNVDFDVLAGICQAAQSNDRDKIPGRPYQAARLTKTPGYAFAKTR